MAISDVPHEVLFEKERRDFWRHHFNSTQRHFMDFEIESAVEWADQCLAEFDKRFSNVADASECDSGE